MKHKLLFFLLLIATTAVFSQNLCENSLPFCTDTVYNFPAGVNAGTAQSGPNYGCLYTQPNPAWYYLEILNPGNLVIYMYSTPSVDIDFALWGPFTDPNSPCVAQLTAACASCPSNTTNSTFYPSGNLVDCSYSSIWHETAHINNAQTGEVYILLITNYSNQPCNINFSQQNAGMPGAGSTNCGILAPPIDNNGPLCVGQTLNLTAQSGPPGSSYYWTGPGGFISTQQNPTIPNVTLAHAGDYFLQIILGTDTSNAVSTTVIVNPVPTSDFTLSLDSICINETTTINYSGTASPSATYSWDVDGGTPNVNTGPGPHNISWPISGNYTITLTVTENGCTSPPTSISVHVKPTPTSTFTVISPVCQKEETIITYTGNANTNATYDWDFSSGTVNAGTNHGPFNVYWDNAGSYSISLTVTENGCVSPPSYQSVVVLPLPVVNISVDIDNGCKPLTVQFNDNINSSPSIFIWNFGDGTPENNQENPTHTYSNAGNYNVSLTVTDTSGCTNNNSFPIIVYPLPVANFIFNPEVGTTGVNIDFNSSSSTGNIVFWEWEFGNNTTSNEQNPTTVYDQTGYHTITLLVETDNGCQDSISKQILIVDIVIPNIFTPNNDGYNDYFVIEGIELVPNCQLIIFNRWGKKVFESNDYKNDWDGNNLADGTYYFIFTLPGNIVDPLHGTVSIIR